MVLTHLMFLKRHYCQIDAGVVYVTCIHPLYSVSFGKDNMWMRVRTANVFIILPTPLIPGASFGPVGRGWR